MHSSIKNIELVRFMKNITEVIGTFGVLPVINITEKELAEPLANALIKGGLPLIEVTLRSECSLNAISIIKKKFPQMTVGAGTVLSKSAVDKAVAAGADFIVTPGYDEEIIDYCNQLGLTITPGCSTPSEIQAALKKGIVSIKFFPSEINGGIKALKLISGPYPEARFIPTGGITYNNLGEYLECGCILACGGSFMASADMLKNREFEKITQNCKRAVNISLGFELAHIGISNSDKESANHTAQVIANIFGFETRECSASTFAGSIAECMHNKKFGEYGHIGIATNSIPRAIAYLSGKGVEFDESSIKKDAKGNITCIYMKEHIAGFAMHIVQK